MRFRPSANIDNQHTENMHLSIMFYDGQRKLCNFPEMQLNIIDTACMHIKSLASISDFPADGWQAGQW